MEREMRAFLACGALALLVACAEPADRTVQPEAPVEVSVEAQGLVAQTLPELVEALAAGEATSETLTELYLERIEGVDRSGPRLQSVLALNPDALMQAKASDARRVSGESLGPLDGVPILLKDNIESADPLATTAGSLALKDNVTGRDSPLVAGLRAEGAVILGKTNLSQWANFRSNNSVSGWSALGGQVRNPHMLDRSPCGSSSGSGAAVAASLAAGAVGTETNGSIICPAQVNGIVGFKPTVGVLSQEGIVPISASQDIAGPMTKTVTGAALMMDAMTGQAIYAADLSAESLNGVRVGVMRFAQGSNADIQALFDDALADLEKAGAILVEIESFSPDAENFWGDALAVLQYEFKDGLNAYLATTPDTVTVRTLADVIAFNQGEGDTELALFGQDLFEASEARGPLSDEDYIRARDTIQAATRAKGIDALMAEHNLAVLVSPSGPVSSRVDPVNGDVWPSWAGAGWMAAIAGYPHASVPMGNVHGIPVGFSLMASEGDDIAVLSYAYAYEQISQKRIEPRYLATAEARPEIEAAMMVESE
jgi:amidase